MPFTSWSVNVHELQCWGFVIGKRVKVKCTITQSILGILSSQRICLHCRTRQTFVGVRQAFPDENFAGVQEEVQLREQDFGNFQDPVKIKNDLAERNRFGRFYFRSAKATRHVTAVRCGQER
eukprot:GHUV01034139.1.p1 GENE.GHUV01034139.1~~GHUV01034139.1.p1  ORF type:complete len:122 (+),score=5.53 GHUV01034139.1:704-1069(+)